MTLGTLPFAPKPEAGDAILALDPGPERTGFVVYRGGEVELSGVETNKTLLYGVVACAFYRTLAIEMIASYGMPVGREVFETCVWIGRYVHAWHTPDEVRLVYRRDVKLHLCGTARAKDGNVRQALIDLFPATGGGKVPQIGIKSKPGPLFGMSTHAWSALGVAITTEAQLAA